MSQVISCWAAIYALATKFVEKREEAKEVGKSSLSGAIPDVPDNTLQHVADVSSPTAIEGSSPDGDVTLIPGAPSAEVEASLGQLEVSALKHSLNIESVEERSLRYLSSFREMMSKRALSLQDRPLPASGLALSTSKPCALGLPSLSLRMSRGRRSSLSAAILDVPDNTLQHVADVASRPAIEGSSPDGCANGEEELEEGAKKVNCP